MKEDSHSASPSLPRAGRASPGRKTASVEDVRHRLHLVVHREVEHARGRDDVVSAQARSTQNLSRPRDIAPTSPPLTLLTGD